MSGDTLIKIQQIHGELNKANFSINKAKLLLKEIEQELGKADTREIAGTIGKFVGDAMVTDDGKRFEVPENYASKSTLVHGDKLKMYEEGGENRFKQVERTKRFRSDGIIAKKEGKWHVVTSDGSYKVLNSAIEHYKAVEGDSAVILLPLDDKYAPFAALESVPGKTPVVTESKPVVVQSGVKVLSEEKSLAKKVESVEATVPGVKVEPTVKDEAAIEQKISQPITHKPNQITQAHHPVAVRVQAKPVLRKKPLDRKPFPVSVRVVSESQPKTPVALAPDESRVLTDEDLR